MGLFDFFKKKEEKVTVKKNDNGTQDNFAFISKDSANGISLEEGKKLQEEILSQFSATDSFSKKVNAAAQLFTKGAFKEAAEVYTELAKQHPEEKGLCEGQIGVAHYLLGDYKRAVSHYKEAMANGDTDMQEDNIFESAEEDFKTNKDDSLLKEYLTLFPNGNYVKKANKLIG